MSDKDLPARLRAMHAARVHHFTPHGHGGQPQPPAFSIVATEERLQDLLTAADMIGSADHSADASKMVGVVTHDQIREAVRKVIIDSGDSVSLQCRTAAPLRSLCQSLGVNLQPPGYGMWL